MIYTRIQSLSGPLPVLFLLTLALSVMACATGNVGGVKKSPEVAQAFEAYTAEPGYHYYLYNMENAPYAVMGLREDYFVKSPDWQPLDPQSKTFKKVIDLVQSFPEELPQAYGSYLFNSEGERIGTWYSTLSPPGIMVDPETKRVHINASRPWLYKKDSSWLDGTGVGIGIGSGGGGVGVNVGF